MKYTIFGAGLSGLIAARMLHPYTLCILEKQESLPNNHHAVLRFRSDAVSKATGITFQKVKVLKAISNSINPVADAVAYSIKTVGRVEPRSIIDTTPVIRYIAPPNLVEQLAVGAPISYGFDVTAESLKNIGRPIISTMPMHVLADIVGGDPGFEPRMSKGWTYVQDLGEKVDLYATIYYPHEETTMYRASVTGSHLMVEGVGLSPVATSLRNALQIVQDSFRLDQRLDIMEGELKTSDYQKISLQNPEDKNKAQRHLLWTTEKHHIYSLGRFACWRPKTMLDDIVQDVQVIRQLSMETKYNNKLKLVRKTK